MIKAAIDRAPPELIVGLLLAISLPVFIWYSGDVLTAVQIAAFPLALAVAWRWPLGIALIFISFSCFRLHDAFPQLQPLRPLAAFGALLILTAGLHVVARNINVFFRRELVLAVVFALHTGIGVLFAADRQIAWDGWSNNFIKVILVALLVAWISKWPRDARPLSTVITLSGFVISLVAIYNWLHGINLVEGTRVGVGEEGSLIGDPNDLTFVLLFSVAFTLSTFLAPETRAGARVLYGGALITVLWAIIATKSRGGLIGVFTAFGVYFFTRYKLGLKHLLMLGAIAAVLVVLSGVTGREYSNEVDASLDDSSSGRLAAWGAAWRMALVRPVFGMGYDNFVESFWAYTALWTGKNKAVHSIWFGVLGESGFVGLAIYLAMVGYTLRSVYSTLLRAKMPGVDPRLRTLAEALAAGIMGTLAAGTFLTQAYSWPVFIQIALIAALANHFDGLQQAATVVPSQSHAPGTLHPTGPGLAPTR